MTCWTLPSWPRWTAALALLAASAPAEVRYVHAGLDTGANDGTSWADAFQGPLGLQAALAVAVPGDRIFVAEGTYLPTLEKSPVPSFDLQSGVELLGGFVGTEGSPDERPPLGSHPSILSGDVPGLRDSTHVVDGRDADGTTLLDGFTIRRGYASYYADVHGGGLVLIDGGWPTVRRCRFTGNRAETGGGAVAISSTAPDGPPTFIECVFEANLAGHAGGAVWELNDEVSARFERCIFVNNRAAHGGAVMHHGEAEGVFASCLFVSNLATGTLGGGAIWILGGEGPLTLTGCTLVGNEARRHPSGGISSAPGTMTIVNSVLWHNLGPDGAHGAENQIEGSPRVGYSVVEGGFPGVGNLAADPRFADADGGDFRLAGDSPAIDAGDNSGIQAGAQLDLAGNPRRTEIPGVPDTGAGAAPVVDMGAYELPWPSVRSYGCWGDGSGAPCPCDNPGAAGHGCANATFADGCRLEATGAPSVSGDTLTLTATSSTPLQPGVFFQGEEAVDGGAGAPFGDGLRCAGTNVRRLEAVSADAGGAASSSVAIALTGGAAAGDVARYQWWYRDPAGSPCGSGSNLSNGVEVVWTP